MNRVSSQDKPLVEQFLVLVSGIGAPLVLLTAIAVAGWLHPNYSHLSQPVSALGAEEAPNQAILNFAGLIPAGVLTFVLSVMMFRVVKGNALLCASAVLVALVGIGRLLAGIFPCDPGCLTFTSSSARIHAVAGMIALSAGAFAPLTFAFPLRKRSNRYWFYLSICLGLGALVALTAGVSQCWPHYTGLFQRTLLILTYAWLIAVTIGIRKERNLSPLGDS